MSTPFRVLLNGGVLVMALETFSRAGEAPSQFLEILAAPGSTLGSGGSRQMYDGLIGSWDAQVVDHMSDGSERRQSAEMHFAWVLEGRAIQDLWIAPSLRDRVGQPGPGNRFGTTLRVYDPAIDAWRITWINPVTGVSNQLVGRRVGSEIAQTGADEDGRLVRWVFVEVTPESFHWRGEVSEDGGRSWTCETEFLARRRVAPRSSPPAPPISSYLIRWE
jgi:hypothetical protein